MYVTVICLCYNQKNYIEEAVNSVLNQTYNKIEIIIVDDGSTDGSKKVINNIVKDHPSIQYLNIPKSIGNCAAFNRGLALAKGQFLIDLAADDVLLADRVAVGVAKLHNSRYGVHYTDAQIINERGDKLYIHSNRFHHAKQSGNLYAILVSQYLICPTSMMFKKEVIDKLKGYDESLTYEDFDFWVRSARYFEYTFSPQVLVKKRWVKGSSGSLQNTFWNPHNRTTYKVCKKIFQMNNTPEEFKALKKRCLHEIGQCLIRGNWSLVLRYLVMLLLCQKKIHHLLC